MKLVLPHDPAKNYYNPDSVRVDTCANPQKYYAKEWFEVTFTVDPFAIPQSPRDSIIERTWQDIDTNYATLRTDMSRLDSAFGMYYFRKKFPDYTDTIHAGSRTYLIRFLSVTRIDSVITLLKESGSTHIAYYKNNAVQLMGAPLSEPGVGLLGRPSMHDGNSGFTELYGQLADNRSFHKLGLQYNLWLLGVPMAWEITKGNSNITIATVDLWAKPGQDDVGHGLNNTGDFYMRVTRKPYDDDFKVVSGTAGGNFIYNEKNTSANPNRYDADLGDKDATISPIKVSPGHHLQCASIATALENNKGMIGVAPYCRTIAITPDEAGGVIDVSSNTPGLQTPDVYSCSYLTGLGSLSRDHMEKYSGVIIGLGANEGAHLYDDPVNQLYGVKAIAVSGVDGGFTTRDVIQTATDQNAYKQKVTRFTQNNEDEHYYIEPCLPICQINGNRRKVVPWDFELQGAGLSDGSNFIDGFDNYNDANIHHQFTSCSNVAAISPTVRGYNNLEWINFSPPQSGQPGKTKNVNIDISVPFEMILKADYDGTPTRYWLEGAVSYAIPQMAGVVGLMKSVDKYLGVALNSSGKPSVPLSVADKAYKVVTFTAKKTFFGEQPDYDTKHYGTDNNSSGVRYNGEDGYKIRRGDNVNITTQGLHYDISKPTNNAAFAQNESELASAYDPLQRSYSNNFGYGLLDAFRCVAHAIPDKNGSTVNVQYAYNTNASLDWTNATTLHAKKFLHLGKFKNSTDRVLEKGGNRFSESGYTEPIWKNNHGKTVVNTDLSVGNDQVLVIDGILTTDGTAGEHTIETTDDGKILITGYLKNVNLEGNVRFADLNVYTIPTTSTTNITSISIKPTSTTENTSEVYGAVTLFGHTKLTVEENATLTVMPGGSINLHGTGSVVVKNGATLRMKYASSMTQNPPTGAVPKIIVETGGTLIVESKARAVEMLAYIEVQEGGEFIVEEYAGIKLGDIAVAPDATMKVNKGADIELMAGKMRVLWGKILLNDNDLQNRPYQHADRVTISGQRDQCGNVVIPSTLVMNPEYPVTRTTTPTETFTYHSFLSARNVDFLDVRLFLHNMKLLRVNDQQENTIENCAFIANSSLNPEASRTANGLIIKERNTLDIQGNLLNIRFNRPPVFREYWDLRRAKIDQATVKGCIFKDNAGKKAEPAVPENKKDNNMKEAYRVSGVAFFNMRSATDENSNHTNLRHGVYSNKCGNVLVHRTGTPSPTAHNFETCDFGVYDESSSVKACMNSFNITGMAVSLNGSSTSVLVQNSINNVGRGSDLESTTIHHHRANQFNSYLHGVTVKAAYANLRPVHYPVGPITCENCTPADIIWGRNKFNIEPLPTTSSGWADYTVAHPFLKQVDFQNNNPKANADCYFVNYDLSPTIDAAQFYLTCGYNDMAQRSQYHISSFLIRTGVTTVGVKYNEMNPSCSVRWNRVSVETGICVKEEDPGCPDITAAPNDCSTLPNTACPDSVPNDGSWAKLDADDSRLTYLNTTALAMLSDTSFDDDCRRIKAFDTHQTAFLLTEDSTRAAVAAASDAFAAIIADTSEPLALRSTAMLLKADIYERLGEFDSAAALYAQHAVDFDSTADMQYRSWRAAELTAYMTDTTRGVIYDSLMGVLHERIFDDKFGPFAPPLVKSSDNEPLHTSEDTPVALEIQPNPFDNTTQLQWRLQENANVRIVVTDALGRVVSEVFNGQCNTGVYSADIDGSGLPIGVYYCRLETMGTVVTRQIALIR